MLSALRADFVDSASSFSLMASTSRPKLRDFNFAVSPSRIGLPLDGFATSIPRLRLRISILCFWLRGFGFASFSSRLRILNFGLAASALWLRLFDLGFEIWIRGFRFAATAIPLTFRSCAFCVLVCRAFSLSWLFGNFSLRLRYSAIELQ